MFDFFQGNYTARDSLRDWQDKNHPWLELTDVHRETTENMRVTVMPFYIGSRVSITSKLAFKSLTIVNEQQNTKIVIQNILVSACVHTHTLKYTINYTYLFLYRLCNNSMCTG